MNIKDAIIHHVVAVPSVAAAIAACCLYIDKGILFLLRFFKPETIKAELDRLDALAKARVDKNAAGNP